MYRKKLRTQKTTIMHTRYTREKDLSGKPFEKNPLAKNPSVALCITLMHTLHTNNNGVRLRSFLQSTWLLPLWHSVLQAHSHSSHTLYNNTTNIVNHRLCNIFLGIRLVLPSMNLTYIYTLCNLLGSLVCQRLHYITSQSILLHTKTITVFIYLFLDLIV